MKAGRFFAAAIIWGMLCYSVSGAEVTIGTGTMQSACPLFTEYHDARTQTIYLASAIGGAKILTSLALDVVTIPGQTMNNFTIRLKHTDLSIYGSSPVWETSNWTTVYQANQTISATGWNTFLFSNPFAYNGVQNLMVDISFDNSDATTSGICRGTSSGIDVPRTFYDRISNGEIAPLMWSNSTQRTSSKSYWFPNIRLGYKTVMTSVPNVTGKVQAAALSAIKAANLTMGSITYVLDDNVPAGNIISQSPGASQSVLSATPVNLIISLGMRYAGSGTADDPYRIASKWDLLTMAVTPTDYNKCFILTADIDLEGQVFTAAIIAADTNTNITGFQGTPFTGLFNGNEHKITHFEICTAYFYLGLFGQVDAGGKIENLGLENIVVNGVYFIGGLAGCNSGGSINNCYSIGKISGVYSIGGLVGYNGGSRYVSTINQCHSISQISGNNTLGGLVGYNDSDISYCYANGNVSGAVRYIGGLVGYNDCSISQSYSTGNVNGLGSVGGLAGYNMNLIKDCYATGLVNGDSCVGGLVGGNGMTIRNCHATGSVSGSSCVGGLVGRSEYAGYIIQCYSTGHVYGASNSSYLGGLVGYQDGGSISECFSASTVNGLDGSFYMGGLVGYFSGGSVDKIKNCYATGVVNGSSTSQYVGGLAGKIYCYDQSTVLLINCYSTSTVNGSTYVGGLTGGGTGGTMNSFWDLETSGQATSYSGTGKTTAQMKTLSMFTSLGWDLVGETTNGTADIWFMWDGKDYPRLASLIKTPMANAGADQTAYAKPSGTAQVTLQGIGFSGVAGVTLTYRWYAGQTLLAEGISPVISLPVGTHTITLIVDDGIEESQPDDVVVTVAGPLVVPMMASPFTLKLSNTSGYVMAMMDLPKGTMLSQLDMSYGFFLLPGDVKAYDVRCVQYGYARVMAIFEWSKVRNFVQPGKATLTLYGRLTSGQYVCGSTTLTVVN